MVCLIDDEDVEGEPMGAAGERIPQLALGTLSRQPGHRDDDPWEESERVRVHAVGSAYCLHRVRVDDGEVEPELLLHLVLPFEDQAGRTHHDHRARAVPQEELLDHQACLDGLAQTYVVGQQEIRTRAGQSSLERRELVGLDVGSAAERGLDGAVVGTRDRTPPQSVDEGCEAVRVVELAGVDLLGEPSVRERTSALLQLPHDSQFVSEAVLLHGLEGHGVLELRGGIVGGAPSQALLLHVDDRPVGPAHCDDLTDVRHIGARGPDCCLCRVDSPAHVHDPRRRKGHSSGIFAGEHGSIESF